MMNKMELLLSKIERRLGTKPLNLPDEINKDHWAKDVIVPDTICTFSRYFPHMVRIEIDAKPENKKNGYYLIDQRLLGGAEILGVRDIAWDVYGNNSLSQQAGIGVYDYVTASRSYSTADIALLQGRANITSMFNNTIYVDFKQPNMVKLESVTKGDITGGLDKIPLDVFVNHPDNLMTIPPTQMETFEKLAIADVALYLLAFLRHFDGIETVFATTDLKLSDIESWASRREDIVQYLDENHVNPANKNQPIMFCV